MLHCFQPVGDHYDGLLCRQRLNSLHQLIFIFRIHICCGFIQEYHGSVLHHGPGDGDALLLTAGERRAALTDHGVIPFRQGLDKVVAAGLLRCFDHILHRRFRLSETNVVCNGIMEQIYALKDEGKVLHQGVHIVLFYVSSIQCNCAGINIPEAGQKIYQRGLSASGRADDSGRGLFRNMERHSVDDPALVVGESDIRCRYVCSLWCDLFS